MNVESKNEGSSEMENNQIPFEIETERLLLRPVKKEDAQDIYEYSTSENVGPNAGWKPHESLEETRDIVDAVFLQPHVFGMVLKESNKLIGTIGLLDDPKREYAGAKMLGYALGEAYWGHGYMTEAAEAIVYYGFKLLGLRLISAYCYPFNVRSKRVLTKLGFQYEGRMALCEVLYSGEVYDNECYAIVAESAFVPKE